MKYQREAISVLIVDDHRLVREGLKSNLDEYDRVSTIYEAGNAQEAIYKASEHSPDVVIMDINLPDLSGMEATRLILENNPEIKVLGLTMHTEKAYVMGMMKAGAIGFLTKTCSAKDLHHAIQKVSSNQAYICDEVLGFVVETAVNPLQTAQFMNEELTRRESQILKLVADGKTNNDISEVLNISTRTVEKHRKNLMDKLDIRTIAQLTKYALKHGLTFFD